MTASIVMNDGGGPVTGSVDNGSLTTINLSNFSNTGILGWLWELVDRPIGSSAVLSATTTSTCSFVADIRGTYLVRLITYTDASRTTVDDADEQCYAIRLSGDYDWRIPAAGETVQINSTRGWAQAVEESLRDLHDLISNPGGYGTLVWEWNGEDVSQFGTAYNLNTSGSISGVAVSAEDNSAVVGGKVLRISASGSGTGAGIVLIADPIVQVGKTLLVEMDFVSIGGAQTYAGLCFLADETDDLHGLGDLLGGVSGWCSKITQSTLEVGSGTNGSVLAAGVSGLVSVTLRCDQVSGGAPRFVEDAQSVSDDGGMGAGDHSGRRRIQAYYTGQTSAFGSSWNDLPLNRMGLTVQVSGGGSINDTDLSRFRILDITAAGS